MAMNINNKQVLYNANTFNMISFNMQGFNQGIIMLKKLCKKKIRNYIFTRTLANLWTIK